MLRLEEVRKSRGINQAKLAKKVGCSQAAICKFETGEMNPSLETLVKLARALDCQLDDLVDKGAVPSAS